MPQAVVQMKNITKTFPGTLANDDVSLTLKQGEIHALLGENGAGKSTLMNVLVGLYKQDSGEILINGEVKNFVSPKDAIASGIGMIHQHFKLINAFTVTENVLLGDKGSLFISKKKMQTSVAKLANEFGLDVDVSAYISQISVGEQQRVEILKSLHKNANILILDEPTAVLTPQEADALFETLRDMTNKGCTIVIISHKLDEIVAIADTVTVLQKGRVAGVAKGKDINQSNLSRLMIGDDIVLNTTPQESNIGKTLLDVKNVCARNDKGLQGLCDVSFEIHEGEILGVAGVAGNGQKELGEVLCGLRTATKGSICLSDKDVTKCTVRSKLDSGLAYVPEDRLGTGLIGNMNSIDNSILRSYYTHKGVFIDYKRATSDVIDAIAEYDVLMADPKAPVRLMSGGNMQKLLLSREIALSPKVLVLSYPVRGLDIGAMEKIYSLMLEQREKGCAILFISEDLDALIKFSDRIMVLHGGSVSGIINREDAKIEELGLMMGGNKEGAS
ncbi:MAG: ABC transporter ATP-binding protein [Clostridia bacterium]|jgi:general nucleoside transport system ATP-binding protein|nr:ABC transporter ATP-binding protein [Clostridia bacterium]MBT7122808.1 ABC transporter ATP-binding protein [Clostridia bacterium]